jgi:sucrose phosphorylase
VRRPRALPLLTPFETPRGTQHVWTTFSADQIDLNVANPDVLFELLRVLLFYVQQGAALIRLDAIGYLYKVIGTNCIHLPQTHLIVQLMRDVLDWAAPDVLLITETNVPHDENISYFGDGSNEAQMVYNFSLPPLLLHTLHTGDSGVLSRWAASIHRLGARTTFFNFTASHDGIGITPALGILSDAEIEALVQRTREHGGFVSYKNNSDGSRSPYELNTTYFDAITPPAISAAQPDVAVRRFMGSQAIMLAFVGVPGVYFHSLFAGRNDLKGVESSGRYRSINREKLPAAGLLKALAEPGSIPHMVFTAYQHLLAARTQEAAFHPLGEQTVLDLGPGVFALERRSPDGQEVVLALHNIRDENLDIQLSGIQNGGWRDLLSGQTYSSSGGRLRVELLPYQVAWLKAL